VFKKFKFQIKGFWLFLPGTTIITQAEQIACIKYLHFNLLNGRSKKADSLRFSQGETQRGRISVAIKNSKISGKSDNPTGEGSGSSRVCLNAKNVFRAQHIYIIQNLQVPAKRVLAAGSSDEVILELKIETCLPQD